MLADKPVDRSASHRVGANPERVALSLFSGAGGMDLGVKQAGFRVLAHLEIDQHCCETLRTNFGSDAKIFQGDVRTIDPRGLGRELGVGSGELDLLFGGPPCQPFSQIGARRGVDDDRAALLTEMARYASALKPQWIVVEQVKGLLSAPGTDGEPGGVFQRLVRRLRGLGYRCTWQVLNAADYGVPQRRSRLFLVATARAGIYDFPAPTHGRSPDSVELPPHVTVGQALGGLQEPPRLNSRIPSDSHADVTPEGQKRRIRDVPEGQWLAAQLHLPPDIRQSLKRKDTTKFRRLHRMEPSLTLRCGEIFFHPMENRYLTPREYMRLHGFPDSFLLRGPIRSRSGQARSLDQHRQVANAVPPPLARAVASQIARTF